MVSGKLKPRESLVQVLSKETDPKHSGSARYLVTALGLEHIEMMAAIGSSQREIAQFLGVSPVWYGNAINEEEPGFDPDVYRAHHAGETAFKMRLRTAQANMAETNAQMAIHLGKHVLGQKDQVQEHRHTHQVVGTMPDYDATSEQWRSQFAPNALQDKRAEAEAIEFEDAEYETVDRERET